MPHWNYEKKLCIINEFKNSNSFVILYSELERIMFDSKLQCQSSRYVLILINYKKWRSPRLDRLYILIAQIERKNNIPKLNKRKEEGIFFERVNETKIVGVTFKKSVHFSRKRCFRRCPYISQALNQCESNYLAIPLSMLPQIICLPPRADCVGLNQTRFKISLKLLCCEDVYNR